MTAQTPALPDVRRYWLVTPCGIEPSPLLTRFKSWLHEEADLSRQALTQPAH